MSRPVSPDAGGVALRLRKPRGGHVSFAPSGDSDEDRETGSPGGIGGSSGPSMSWVTQPGTKKEVE